MSDRSRGRPGWAGPLLVGAALLALLAGSGGAAAHSARIPAPVPSTPGIEGTVAVVDSWCPFAGCGLEALIIARRGDRIVAKARSDAAGRYEMDLPPGRYEVRARPGIRSIACPRVTVDVPWGTRVELDFGCRWARPGAEASPAWR